MESQKISDEASIVFGKALYQALYTHNGYTICEAFKAAKEIVKLQSEGSSIQAGEHNKYVLKCRHKNKVCPVFDADLQLGKPKYVTPIPVFKNLPGKIDSFIGRSSECQKVVEALVDSRLVTLTGIAGIGKSAIVKEVCHYLFARRTMKDGILYFSLVD